MLRRSPSSRSAWYSARAHDRAARAGAYVHLTAPFVAALAYIVSLGTALAFWPWFFIMERLSAATAGISSLLAPVVSVVAAWIQLHEQPGASELIGMACIIAALAVNSSQSDVRRAST